ncbi:hypothetical protein [Neisseria elongata]|jgi:hypothetical protein|uniref:Uncharacterized protein n=1 Tax=Neisseria elongata subsp. nitroreducens TaxID=90367 RepID=A0A9X0ZQ48_NEIEL|nr:hypothetical protein [Neisseria elongata]MBS9339340.1 hypothetical protein [Neisseria elongata subsp. nitroreducens]
MKQKRDMSQADVEAIIAEVFRVSSIKLTADDPVIAILLIQEGRLKALFEEQRISKDWPSMQQKLTILSKLRWRQRPS